jgi:hypothetical protein
MCECVDAKLFVASVETEALRQLVPGPTHRSPHTERGKAANRRRDTTTTGRSTQEHPMGSPPLTQSRFVTQSRFASSVEETGGGDSHEHQLRTMWCSPQGPRQAAPVR